MGLIDSPLHRRCGAEEETSADGLCECEVLATPWPVRILEFYVRLQSGTLLMEQDSHDLDVKLGASRACQKGLGATGQGWTHLLFYSIPVNNVWHNSSTRIIVKETLP